MSESNQFKCMVLLADKQYLPDGTQYCFTFDKRIVVLQAWNVCPQMRLTSPSEMVNSMRKGLRKGRAFLAFQGNFLFFFFFFGFRKLFLNNFLVFPVSADIFHLSGFLWLKNIFFHFFSFLTHFRAFPPFRNKHNTPLPTVRYDLWRQGYLIAQFDLIILFRECMH